MSAAEYQTEIDFDLDDPIRKPVLYAAAFICAGITNVRYENGACRFVHDRPIEEQQLRDGLNVLVGRFGKAKNFESETVFEQPLTGSGKGHAEVDALEDGRVIQEVYNGMYVWREPVSTLIRFLDAVVLKRFAAVFEAKEELYPNVIAVETLRKTNHFSSFPEHLHFVTHLESDLSKLDSFAQQSKEDTGSASLDVELMERPGLVHNPSTCYHCYAALKNTKIENDTAITAVTSCHRYEGANHHQRGRLMEFSLREVIFLGSPDYVRQTRMKTLDLMEELAKDWELAGAIQSENDPFFTSDYEVMADHQRKMRMKYEYKAVIPGDDNGLAIMSSNLHGLVFSKAFEIGSNGPLHTGCLGFGLERLAIVIIAQHGADPEQWPEKLKNEWREFLRDGDALRQ